MPCRSASRSSAAVATMRASTPSATKRVSAVSAPTPPTSTTGRATPAPSGGPPPARGSPAGRSPLPARPGSPAGPHPDQVRPLRERRVTDLGRILPVGGTSPHGAGRAKPFPRHPPLAALGVLQAFESAPQHLLHHREVVRSGRVPDAEAAVVV